MRVQVKCLECGHKMLVEFSVKAPWPKCCGYTMRLSHNGGKRFVKEVKEIERNRTHCVD